MCVHVSVVCKTNEHTVDKRNVIIKSTYVSSFVTVFTRGISGTCTFFKSTNSILILCFRHLITKNFVEECLSYVR